MALEAPQRVAVEPLAGLRRRSRACWRRSSVRRMRCTSTPITPELSPWPPNAATASRARSPMSPSRPCADRILDLRAAGRRGRCARRPRSASPSGPCSIASRLDGVEEEAVEQQLEEAPVLLRLGERRRERLAEVLALGPGHLARARGRRRGSRPCRPARPPRAARRRSAAAAGARPGALALRAGRRRGRRGAPASRSRLFRGRHRRAARRRARRRGRGRCGA